jgi:hypothetical protein
MRKKYVLLVVLLICTLTPYLVTLWNYNTVIMTSNKTLQGTLEFSAPIVNNPLLEWSYWVYAEYADFRTGPPWDDDIRINIEVQNDTGHIVTSIELDLNIHSQNFLLGKFRQYGSLILPVPAPGIYVINMTTEFDQPVQVAVVHRWQPLMDILFIIAIIGGLTFVAGICSLLIRRRRVTSLIELQ